MDFSKGCQIYPNLAEQVQDLDIGILGILLITIVSSFCDMHFICHISNAWPKDPKVKAAMMSYSYIHKFKAYDGVICNTVTPAINIIILYYGALHYSYNSIEDLYLLRCELMLTACLVMSLLP